MDDLHYLKVCHSNMMARCYNERCPSFKFYVGRGIKVCDEWLTVAGFIKSILETIGHRPAGVNLRTGLSLYQLDRKNSYGDYSPDNCRWVTVAVNQANKRPAKNRREPFPGYQVLFTNSSSGYLTFSSAGISNHG